MSASSFRPCPFCRSLEQCHEVHRVFCIEYWYVECVKCGARGPEIAKHLTLAGTVRAAKAQSTKAWNRQIARAVQP
jgi:hypothetical protein